MIVGYLAMVAYFLVSILVCAIAIMILLKIAIWLFKSLFGKKK